MKNKKFILVLILIILPALTIIGVATWYITNDVNSNPKYSFEEVVQYLYGNSKEYNGKPIILDEQLIDCSISYKTVAEDTFNNGGPVNAGNYVIRIIDTIENQIIDIDYIITPKPIEKADIVLDGDQFVYVDTNVEPEISTVIIDDLVLSKSDYDIDYLNNTSVGTGTIKITGKGNYTGTALKNFTISAQGKDILIELSDKDFVTDRHLYSHIYDKNSYIPEFIVTSEGTEINVPEDKIHYTVTKFDVGSSTVVESAINKGLYQLVISIDAFDIYKETQSDPIEIMIDARELSLGFSTISNIEYDGQEHTPNVICTNVCEGDNVIVECTESFTNSGSYKINKLSLSGNDKENYALPNTDLYFTIDPRTLNVVKTVYEMDYSASNRTWSVVSEFLKTSVSFIDNNGKFWTPLSYDVVGIWDGSFGYGEYSDRTELLGDNNSGSTKMVGVDSLTNIVGGTYLATFKVNDNNFTLSVNNNSNIFKFKTVIVDGINKYFTIEDAIAQHKNITFIGDKSSENSYVYTSFCNLLEKYPYDSKSYELSNITMTIPCQAEAHSEQYIKDPNDGFVYASLYIPSDVTLSLVNSAKVVVDAIMSFKQPNTTITCNRGVLLNNGTIVVNNGCQFISYGYVKGNGLIDTKADATIQDCIHTYDWPGGSATFDIYSSVLPTNAWSIHNIGCQVKIDANATMNIYLFAWVKNKAYMGIGDEYFYTPTVATIICPESTNANSLLQGKSGYILKTTTPAISWLSSSKEYKELFLIDGSNQVKGQRDNLTINGSYIDSTLSISIKNLIPMTFKTSTSIVATIGFMDLVIEKNSNLSLSKSSYIFLPGSTLKVEEGAVVNIGEGVNVSIATYNEISALNASDANGTQNFANKHCVDKNPAKAIINGELIVSGSIGGTWLTERKNAIINVSNGSVTSSYTILIADYDPRTGGNTSLQATGLINSSSTESETNISTSNLVQGNVYVSNSTVVDGKQVYYWSVVSVDKLKKFTINFYESNSDTTPDTKVIYLIGNNSYEINGNEYSISKPHYIFNGWLKKDGSSATGTIIQSNESIDLYADMSYVTYDIVYQGVYESESGIKKELSSDIFSSLKSEFTLEDFVDYKLNLSTITYNDALFKGWYLGTDASTGIKLNYISLSDFEDYISQYGNTLYLYCEFKDEVPITVSFNMGIDDDENAGIVGEKVENGCIKVTSDEVLVLPDVNDYTKNSYNNNKEKEKYFDGWQIKRDTKLYKPGDTISYNTLSQIDGDKEFIAIWKDKYYVSFYDANYCDKITLPSGYYVVPDERITLSFEDEEEYNEIGIKYIVDYYKIDGFEEKFDSSNQIVSGLSNYVSNNEIYIYRYLKELYKINYSDEKKIIESLTYNGIAVEDGMYVEGGGKFKIVLKNSANPFVSTKIVFESSNSLSKSFAQEYTPLGIGTTSYEFEWTEGYGELNISIS